MKIILSNASFYDKRKLFKFIMKTYLFLFCSVVFGFTSNPILSQNAKIKVAADKTVTMDEVFDLIMNQTDYTFIYQVNLFKNYPQVKLKKGIVSVNELLNQGNLRSNFKFDFSDKNTIIVSSKPNNEIKISGKIVDKSGLPVIGDTVYVTNVKVLNDKSMRKDFIVRGTSTDIDGMFTLIAEEGYYLVVSAIGFEFRTELLQPGKRTYDITLKEEISALNEIVIVGYGETARKNLTGSISSIEAEDIQQIKTQTIDQALVGKMSGVFVQNKSGQPGAGAFVQIRGLSQVRGDNQPLYVIDGVPITITPNSESVGLINSGDRENPLLSINPDDIERVDVLKDPSATAIYGSRAANGVVIVTTKKGKRNEVTKFSFNSSATIQNPVKKYDYLSSSEYIDWAKINAQKILDQYPSSFWPLYFKNQYAMVNDPDNYFGKANTDWQDLITNDNALWTQYSFNASGGSKNVNYYTSVGISDQDGVMLGNNFTRYTYSGRIDADVTEKFKVGTSINYNYSINKNEGFSNLSIGDFRPDLSPYDEKGEYSTYEGLYGEQYTALGNGKQKTSKAISKNLLGTVYGEIEIINGLKFKSQINIGLNDNRIENFYSSKNAESLFQGMYYSKPGARLGVQTNASWSTTFTNTINYNKVISENHKIDAVLGISWDRSRYDTDFQSYRGFPDDNILININSASFFDQADSEHLQQGLNSLFGRINYSYKNKYLFTFTGRRDGSTKFGPENQYGLFPSGAIAWNVHNEEFMKNISFINQLKLRASMGRVGSDNLPSFTYLSYYQSLSGNASVYDGQNGIVVQGVPNRDIKWEQTDQLDLGIEFGLFNNRINGEIVYYEKNTSGIILFNPIPSETGSTSWNTNVADVSNRGWEFSVGSDIIRSKNFNWNTSFNISTVINNVDNLYGANTGTQTGIIQGQPIGVIVGYDVVKIAQTQNEINDLNSAAGGVYQATLTKPGDYIFKDINKDGVINTLDRGPIGNPNPNFFGGWNNKLSYKNWDFTMNWNFVQGTERVYKPITDLYAVDVTRNVRRFVLDTWSENNTNAAYARYGSATNGFTPTSRAVVDGSYAKLRSASISYNLPKEVYGNLAVNNVKLTLSGNNLLAITNYPGLDPEDIATYGFANRSSSFNADNAASYPNTRSFTFTLNVTF